MLQGSTRGELRSHRYLHDIPAESTARIYVHILSYWKHSHKRMSYFNTDRLGRGTHRLKDLEPSEQIDLLKERLEELGAGDIHICAQSVRMLFALVTKRIDDDCMPNLPFLNHRGGVMRSQCVLLSYSDAILTVSQSIKENIRHRKRSMLLLRKLLPSKM